MAPKVSEKKVKLLSEYQAEFKSQGFDLVELSGEDYSSKLTLALITKLQDSFDDRTILITKGQLDAGLPIPLFNPKFPLFYEIISHKDFQRAIFQINGDSLRIVLEFAYRAKTGKSMYDDSCKKDKYKHIAIVRSQYTVDNFFKNYKVVPMKDYGYRWAFRCSKVLASKLNKDEMLMRDIDYHTTYNNFIPRFSHDTTWDNGPLLLKGPYVSGSCTLPPSLSTYCPWLLNWPEREEQIEELKELYKEKGNPDVRAALGLYTSEVIIVLLIIFFYISLPQYLISYLCMQEIPFVERVIVEATKRKANDDENGGAEGNAGGPPKKKTAATTKRRVSKRGPKNAPSHSKDKSCSQDPSSNLASRGGDNVENLTDGLDGTPLPVSSSSESSMSKLAGIFSEAQTSDSNFKNATRCVAYVGESMSSGKRGDYRGISSDVTPDFLSSLLTLVRISTLVYMPFYL